MQKILSIDEAFYRELGHQYRLAREHRDMTQKEVAQETGLSRPILINYEYGYTRIKAKKWQKMCEALGISPKIEVSVKIGVE